MDSEKLCNTFITHEKKQSNIYKDKWLGIQYWIMFRSILYIKYFNKVNKTKKWESKKIKRTSLRTLIKRLKQYISILRLKQSDTLVIPHAIKVRGKNSWICRYTEFFRDSTYNPLFLDHAFPSSSFDFQNNTIYSCFIEDLSVFFARFTIRFFRLINYHPIPIHVLLFLENFERDVELDISRKTISNNLIFIVVSSIIRRYFYSFLLSIIKPKLVVLTDYYHPRNILFIQLCQQKGIKTIELQHGTISSSEIWYNFPKSEVLGFPDYFFSFGPYWSQVARYPIPRENRIDFGFPNLNNMNFTSSNNRNSEKVILIISQPSLSDYIIPFTEKAAYELGNEYRILFKLHPREVMSFQSRKIHKELPSRVEVISDTNLYKYIRYSDVVVGVNSTSILEAVYFEKQVLLINAPGVEILHNIDNNVFKVIDSPIEISNYFHSRNSIVNLKKEIWSDGNLSKFERRLELLTAG